MAWSDSSNPFVGNMPYIPPPLPEYFSRTHTLEIIVGVPTEEQVKAVHDTIRAVNSVANVPALYDSKLSNQLAQYLFTVQMAVYRNEYPLNIFPGENTYTPPTVPSPIPISLDPVVGAPSDEQLESAHNAVRTLDNLANSPFFDSALSAKLSQHVFNIQFARYIQDSNQGQFTRRPASSALPSQTNVHEPSIVITSSDMAGQRGVDPAELATSAPDPTAVAISSGVPNSIAQSSDKLDQICTAQQETNRLLGGNEELLRDIRRALVTTHFSAHRGINGNYDAYQTMNQKGELPWMHYLGDVWGDSNGGLSRAVTGQELVGYLKFYNIGAETIEGETGTLKPGKEADAQKLLGYYLYRGCSSAPQAG